MFATLHCPVCASLPVPFVCQTLQTAAVHGAPLAPSPSIIPTNSPPRNRHASISGTSRPRAEDLVCIRPAYCPQISPAVASSPSPPRASCEYERSSGGGAPLPCVRWMSPRDKFIPVFATLHDPPCLFPQLPARDKHLPANQTPPPAPPLHNAQRERLRTFRGLGVRSCDALCPVDPCRCGLGPRTVLWDVWMGERGPEILTSVGSMLVVFFFLQCACCCDVVPDARVQATVSNPRPLIPHLIARDAPGSPGSKLQLRSELHPTALEPSCRQGSLTASSPPCFLFSLHLHLFAVCPPCAQVFTPTETARQGPPTPSGSRGGNSRSTYSPRPLRSATRSVVSVEPDKSEVQGRVRPANCIAPLSQLT